MISPKLAEWGCSLHTLTSCLQKLTVVPHSCVHWWEATGWDDVWVRDRVLCVPVDHL